MKKIIFIFTLYFSFVHLFAQNDKKNQIGTYFAIGTSVYGIPWKIGGGSYHTKYYYSVGLDYSRYLSKRWNLCRGIEYTYNDMTVKSHDSPEIPPGKVYLKLKTIPVQMK